MKAHTDPLSKTTLFFRADKMRENGNNRAAFQLFLKAAKQGDVSSRLNAGYCFDVGLGTRRNSSAAMYWYKRAYRSGDASAANNIGTIWRDRARPQRAQFWFRRAVQMGNDGSNLELAKYELAKHNPRRAMKLLQKVRHSQSVSESEIEEAERLLKIASVQLLKVVPPQSIFRLVRSDAKTPGWKHDVGRIFRIGYYSRQDGPDVIWLVDEKGRYEQTTDRRFLLEYFEPIQIATERSFYGIGKAPLGALRPSSHSK